MGTCSDIDYDVQERVYEEIPPPAVESFETSGLHPLLLKNLKRCNYVEPTPIQKRAIPIIMGGRDLMGCAHTGSGKTAAYLLPIVNELIEKRPDRRFLDGLTQPQVIILSPTRELAYQLFSITEKFTYRSHVACRYACGGTNVSYQSSKIREGCHILVATPGSLLAIVDRYYLSFKSVKYLVLDEADCMLDVDFIGSVEKIISHPSMPPIDERQTVMFSTTFPEAIQSVAIKFLKENFLLLNIDEGGLGGACADVDQVFYNVHKFQKKAKLEELLRVEGSERTVIFVETKRRADFIAKYLSELNYNTISFHGDCPRRERKNALPLFNLELRNVLVATAVASRGLDIKDVKHVIIYDMPKSINEYVRRIGLTGRAGNRGRATSFFCSDSDTSLAPDLVKILTQTGNKIPDFLSDPGYGKARYSKMRIWQ